MKRNGNTECQRCRGGGVWGGGISLSGGGGGTAPSPENFFIFCLAMEHFGAFWALVLMLV